ncbi:MAG TPA: ATP-binding protein [Caulobacteraceae bacterium]
MASDTATARADPGDEAPPRPRQPRFRGSRLGGFILALNLLSLLILFVGALALNEWRRGLIEARQESLLSQAQLIANVLYRADATQGEPEPALDPVGVSLLLGKDIIPPGQRARVFDVDGLLVADSYTVSDAILVEPLPPVRARGEPAETPKQAQSSERRVREARDALAAEVARAARDGAQASIRRSEAGDRVVSVSIPIRHVRAVLGVLTVETGDVDEIVAAQRRALIPFALVALGVSLLSSILLHVFVARPVRRLAFAADRVRLQQARAISLPDISGRNDEIGDLARSLESMTETLSTRMDAIERFAADVSHEIKNPLTSIRSAVETLDLVKNDAMKARLTQVLQQDVRRLDRLITDISNASRLDAELSREQPKPVELARLLADIAGLTTGLRAGVSAGGAPVRFEAAAGEPPRVIGREDSLGQVFRNLIDNARSFSPPDSEVRVSLLRDRETDPARPVVVRVDDDGPGVPPENLETIFERFYTSRPKGTAFGGNSGLGLSIARQIVAAHGGTIRAENRLAADGGVAGARFTVALPEA